MWLLYNRLTLHFQDSRDPGSDSPLQAPLRLPAAGLSADHRVPDVQLRGQPGHNIHSLQRSGLQNHCIVIALHHSSLDSVEIIKPLVLVGAVLLGASCLVLCCILEVMVR